MPQDLYWPPAGNPLFAVCNGLVFCVAQAHLSSEEILGELPEATLAGSKTIGVLRLAVACAPAALRMTQGDGVSHTKKLNSYKATDPQNCWVRPAPFGQVTTVTLADPTNVLASLRNVLQDQQAGDALSPSY